MKIVHVAESAKGGVGTYLRELTTLQRASLGAANVHVIAPAEHSFQIGDAPAGSVIGYHRPDRSLASLHTLAATVGEVVDQLSPDVIHIHSTFAGLVVRSMFGWRRDRPRLIYCPHGWSFDVRTAAWKRAAAIALEVALSGMCDEVVAVSSHEANLARRFGVPASKIKVVLNGVAESPPVPVMQMWNDPRLKVLFIGRFDQQKGVDTLFDAVEPLQDQLCVRIIGDTVAGGARLRPLPAVERLGWCSPAELQGQLEVADVVVVPSRWEAFGLVALEAMRAGRMVVASNVGGLPEVVEHGVTGWLCPPDSPVALGRLLQAARRVDRDAMGENGRRRFQQHFTAGRMHRRLLDIYRGQDARSVGESVAAFT